MTTQPYPVHTPVTVKRTSGVMAGARGYIDRIYPAQGIFPLAYDVKIANMRGVWFYEHDELSAAQPQGEAHGA